MMKTFNKKTPQITMFDTLTNESFDAFIKLLNEFDFNYFITSDRRDYAKGKAQELKIDSICKNHAFNAIYEIWLECEYKKITKTKRDILLTSIKKEIL